MDDETSPPPLFRVTCVPPLELQQYYFHELVGHRQGEVAAHLAHCPLCAADYDELVAFMRDESSVSSAPAPGRLRAAMDKLVVSFATLVPPLLSPVRALRGEAAATQLYEAEDLAVAVDVSADPATGRHTLSGQVLAPDPEASLDGRVQATPRSAPTRPRETILRANGSFELAELPSDRYQLILVLPSRRIIIPDLAVGSTAPPG